MKVSKLVKLLVAMGLFGAVSASHASLVQIGTVYDTGAGFGNVNTVLTLQNDNQSGDASGSVSYSGGGDVTSGDTLPGPVHNKTYSFADLNVTQALDLKFIFNAVEPGNAAANGVTLEDLVLSIYSDTGVSLFTASLAAPVTFAETESGIGKSGYVFGLDAIQAALAQAFVGATNRIGLAATLSGATGGPDTFAVSFLDDDVPPNEVPEPGSVALLGLAVAGVWAVRRRGGV